MSNPNRYIQKKLLSNTKFWTSTLTHDTELNKDVVIKAFNSFSPLKYFTESSKLMELADFSHENLIKYNMIDFDKDKETCTINMDYFNFILIFFLPLPLYVFFFHLLKSKAKMH